MVERVFPKRPSRCGTMEGSGQAGAGALVGTQQPLKAGSLAASCRRQAPCTASLVVPAPLGPRREAPGLLQLWGVLLRGESTALCWVPGGAVPVGFPSVWNLWGARGGRGLLWGWLGAVCGTGWAALPGGYKGSVA